MNLKHNMRSEEEIRNKIKEIKLSFTDRIFDDLEQQTRRFNFSLKEARLRIDTLNWVLGLSSNFSALIKRTNKEEK